MKVTPKVTAKDVLVQGVLGIVVESKISHDELKAILKEIEEQHYHLTIKNKI
ncbi:MAG: hypothetical protein MRZ40_02710 [Ligilactobacillus animalis]|uniref:hypothetical protein n=1 Tax=Ligilactobacillus animalis TaxID=1605 RepID=UPI00242D68EE|nr:hypothetical protein [Ligilactobacillus animalis]MCI5941464.1 hypothetical protein [Ligilactobacillus animalis]MDY2992931.1 hypothetical protein [Ligilactobacillus animalis]